MKHKQYCAYVDGGCPNNGRQAQSMFGSYLVYDVTGKGFSHDTPGIHEELKAHHPIFSNLNFDLTVKVLGDVPADSKPKKVTNNSAEALSLLCLLMELDSQGVLSPNNKVIIFMDSELTMYQVMGIYKVKQPHLKVIHANIRKLFNKLKKKYGDGMKEIIGFHWISGDQMKETAIGH